MMFRRQVGMVPKSAVSVHFHFVQLQVVYAKPA